MIAETVTRFIVLASKGTRKYWARNGSTTDDLLEAKLYTEKPEDISPNQIKMISVTIRELPYIM